jgi:hypothetical protein
MKKSALDLVGIELGKSCEDGQRRTSQNKIIGKVKVENHGVPKY